MKSRLNLKPGQRGTKKLVDRYGESLLYVRYRYDENRGVRLKTVEIVIEEKPWQPSPRIKNEDMVAVMVEFSEKALQSRLKSAGGRWDPKEKLWFVSYGNIRGTDLEGRMLKKYTKKKDLRKHLI